MSGWASAGAPVFLVAKAKPSPKGTAQNRSQRSVASSSSAPPIGLLSAAVSRGRSRSPVRVALPGLRSDGPGRLDRRFAGFPRVLTDDERSAAHRAARRRHISHDDAEDQHRQTQDDRNSFGPLGYPNVAAYRRVLQSPGGYFEAGEIFVSSDLFFGLQDGCGTPGLYP